MGAAVQAMTGAFLVRRFVGFPNPLDEERDVLKFMALAGPLSCLVSATIGVTSLLLAGAVSLSEYVFNWCTWWVGDTVGVLIAAPLALIWAGEPREIWRQRRISVALPLCFMLTAAIVIFVHVRTWEQDRIKSGFERRADELADAIKEKLDDHLDVLHAVEAFYASSSEVHRRDFQSFVRHAFVRYPGLQALSWDLRIPGAKRVDSEEAARRDGYPDFQITEQNAQGQLVRAAERPEYVAVYYIEPYKGNESALGFDIASDPIRLEALTRARDTGQPTATARIRLVQETGQEFGFRVFLPIYGKGLPYNTPEERRKSLQGFATAVFRVADIVEGSVKDLHKEGIELRFSDETAPVGKRLLYRRPAPAYSQQLKGDQEEHISAGLRWVTSFEDAGRKWAMTFSLTRAYLLAQRSWQTWGVLAAALLVSALLGAFLLVVTGRAAKVEVQVAQRTAELSQSNANLEREIVIRRLAEERLAESEARLRTIVASEPEWVKLLDQDGRVLEINPAGLAMLEADSAAQVLGQSVYSVVTEEYRRQFKELNESVFQGNSGSLEFEIIGLKGTRRWLETHAVPVRDSKGNITGALSVTRDISERKRLEKEISEIREGERRRLGQDLHDDLGQNLAGIALLTKGLEQRLSAKSSPETADAAQITELVNQAVARTRSIVRGLLPVDPIAHGLTSALEELASRTEAMFNIACKLECRQPVEVDDNSVATHLFRIAQEAVANAVKHGQARQVLISLSQLDGRTVLMVSDDGVGFPEAMREHKGMGLHIMKHRAEVIGGSLDIRRLQDGGTVLTCSFQN
jgi:PAS domain S-box-containing protein